MSSNILIIISYYTKRSKIYLLFNPDKFAAGTKVTWKSDNTAIKMFPTVKSIPRNGNKIPLAIQCDVLGAKGTISATVKSKEGKSEKAETLIKCVEPGDITPPKPTAAPVTVTVWLELTSLIVEPPVNVVLSSKEYLIIKE